MSILSYVMCDCGHLDCDTMCDFSESCNHKETIISLNLAEINDLHKQIQKILMSVELQRCICKLKLSKCKGSANSCPKIFEQIPKETLIDITKPQMYTQDQIQQYKLFVHELQQAREALLVLANTLQLTISKELLRKDEYGLYIHTGDYHVIREIAISKNWKKLTDE